MSLQGHIHDVVIYTSGSELLDPIVSGSLVLLLHNVDDFNDDGGLLSIDGAEPVAYLSRDTDGESVTLAVATAADLEEGIRVDVSPVSREKRANIVITNNDDEPIWALVPHDFDAQIDTGVREPEDQESVEIDVINDRFQITNIMGREPQINGQFLTPGTVVDANTPDGAVPPQVTGVTLAAGVRSIFLTWTAVANDNVTWYWVYGSDAPGVPLDAEHLLGKAVTNRFTAYSVWDSDIPGTVSLSPGAIDPTTLEYTPHLSYFKVVAEDSDGMGTASDEVSGEPAVVTAADLAVDSVTADHLRSNSVDADKLDATIVHAGEQYIGLIHLHPTSGITVPQIGSEDVTHLASDGTGNQFAGGITANDGLTSYGGINMQGTDNFLAGELKGGAGVNNPGAAPTVTSSYDLVQADAGGGFYRKGLADFHDATPVWVTTDTYPGGPSNVQGWAKTGGPAFWGFDVLAGWQAYGGVTHIGAYYYVLCRQFSSPTNWRILIYNAATEAYVTSFDTNPLAGISISTTAYPAIGHDGTNICIAWVSAGILYCRRIKPYGVAGAGDQSGNTLSGGAWSASHHIAGVQQVAGFMYISGVNNSAIMGWTIGSTTLTRNTAKDFPKNVGAITGFMHDGATWTTFNSGKTFTKHTTNEGQLDFGHDWTDADTGGSGIAHTLLSPLRRVTPTKFAKWTVTVPSFPPDDLTTDGANTARIFAGVVGASIVFQHQLVTDGDGITGKPLSLSKTFDVMATTGAAPSASNDFSSRPGAIGRFSSTQADGANPMWNLDGDGAWKLGKFLKGNADGTDAMDTGWINITKAAVLTSGTLRYRIKSGWIEVHVDGAATCANAATIRLDASALAAAYRPSVQARTHCYMGGFAGTLTVGTDGTVNATNNTGLSRASVSGVISWPIT